MRTVVALVAVLLVGGLLAAGLGAAEVATDEQQADLHIEQPAYVDGEVEVESTGNGTIYHVEGGEQRIRLLNADHGDVVSVGVADGSGDIEYDEERDLFEFETTDEGTTEVFFVVEETVNRTVEEGNVTVTREETEQTRYSAILRVENVEWVHRTVDEEEELQEDASNWQEVRTEVQRVADVEDDDEIMSVIGTSLSYYVFAQDGFGPLIGQIQATILTLVLTPGGLVVLSILLGIPAISLYSLLRYRNKREKQFADVEDIEREKARLADEKTKQILSQCDLNEIMPDDLAAANRKLFGRDVWQTWRSILLLQSPTQVKGTILQLMGQVGYQAEVKRDSTGQLREVTIIRDAFIDPDEQPGEVAADGGMEITHRDLTTLSNEDPDDLELIEMVDGEDLDLDIFDRPDQLDPSKVSLPIDNRDVEDADLIQAVQPEIPGDFSSEEQMAECIGEIIQFVETHPTYTDEEGYVDDGVDLLSYLAEMNTVMAHEADFPAAYSYRRFYTWIADEMDPEGKLDEHLQEIDREGPGGDARAS